MTATMAAVSAIVKGMEEIATAMVSVAEIVIIMGAAVTVATTALLFPLSPF